MPVDRDLLKEAITKEGAPNWPCPTCRGGHLRLVPGSLSHAWTAQTNKASSEDFFEASLVEQRFVAVLICDNKKCKETAVVAGTGRVDEWPDEEKMELLYEDVFYPTYFMPSPRLINLPANCPSEVAAELEQAFVASWGDPSAAGNRIRTAVERLLDSLRVQKQVVTAKSKRESIGLHSRIAKIRTRYPDAHDSLLAIKWLGNAGSHASTLSREAVYDALDIFESVLHTLYSKHTSAIKRLVKAVNARKGPARKRG